MTNFVKKEDAKVASLPLEDPVEPVVVKEARYVMLFNEMSLDELDDLKRHFDVYLFNSKADYKISVLELLRDCELFLIDVTDKDAVFYWSEMVSRLEECEYEIHTLYKGKKGTKIDIPKLKALYAVEHVVKYLPDAFIKNTQEYIRRMLIDHIPESESGCGLLGCFKKTD